MKLEPGLNCMGHLGERRVGLTFFGRSGMGRRMDLATILYEVCARVREPS